MLHVSVWHNFYIKDIPSLLPIINFTASASSDAIVPETEKLFMEGRIVQKLDCRPYKCNALFIYGNVWIYPCLGIFYYLNCSFS